MLKDNIRKMDVSKTSIGMDIVIISCSTMQQEEFWQKRLNAGRGSVLKPSAMIITIHEDWEGGAGNGLGSLYAYQQAREKGYVLYKTDIFQKQREGQSIALYHTAGDGQRLYPITAAEYGNKSAVKLPSYVKIGGKEEPITLLEATLKQTAIYAPARKGRLSVFWADQIFIPSNSPDYTSRHHADILVKLMPMPTEEEWQQKNLSKYGLITLNKQGQAQAIDKADWGTLKQLIGSGKMSIAGGVGLSMGSFSLSCPLTFALMQEFQPELIQKNVKMDADPYFWMALTLDQASYIQALLKKGISAEEAKNHHLRIQYFKSHFLNKHHDVDLFGIVDIGVGSYWWDFGNIESYTYNLLKMTQNTVEGYLLREFFHLEQDYHSTVFSSYIGKGNINSSIVFDTTAEDLNADHSVVIGSVVRTAHVSGSLLYSVLDEDPIHLSEGSIRADVYLGSEDTHVKLTSKQDQDPKELWAHQLPQNSMSFKTVSDKILTENENKCSAHFKQLKNALASQISEFILK